MWKIPSNRFTRIAARVIKITGVVALFWLLIQYLLLPPLIHSIARNALAGLGLADIQFTVRTVSPFRTELEDLQFAPGTPSNIQAISIAYSPFSLIRGRISSIRLTGAQIELAYNDGQLDLSSLGFHPAPPGKKKPAASGKPSTLRLPLERIELRASAINFHWQDTPIWIPVSGVVTQEKDGISADLDATVQNAPIHITGTLAGPDNALAVKATCTDAQAAALLAILPRSLLERVPALASGQLSLDAAYQQSPDSRHTAVTLSGRRLRASLQLNAQRIDVHDLSFSAHAELDNRFGLSVLTASAQVPRMNLGDYEMSQVRLSAEKKKDLLVTGATFAGPGYAARKLDVSLAGVLPAKNPVPFRAQAAFDLSGRLPAPLMSLLATHGIQLSALGPATLTGTAVYEKADNAWEASARDIALSIAPGTLDIPNALVQGFSADLHVSASADPYAIRIKLLPGSSMQCSNVLGVPGLNFTRADKSLPLAQVSVADEPLSFSQSLTAEGWQVLASKVNVTTAPIDLALPQDIRARTVSFSGPISLDLSPIEYVFRPLTHTPVSVGAITFKQGDLDASLRQLSASLDEPVVYSPISGTTLAATLGSDQPLDVHSAQFSGSAGKTRLSASIRLPLDAAPAITGQVQLSGIDVKAPQSKFAATGASITLPFAVGADAPPSPGAIDLPKLALDGSPLPPVHGTVSLVNRQLTLSASAPVLEKALASVSATLDASQSPLLVRGTMKLPHFKLSDKAALARLAPALKGYDVTGDFAADGSFTLRGGHFYSSATLNVTDARMVNSERQWTIDGISGAFTLDSLYPLRSRPGQRFTIKSAKLNKLQFTSGVCTFRMDNPQQYLIEELAFDFAGGRLFTNTVDFDLRKAKLTAFLTADKVQLSQIVPLLLNNASGSGALYGRVPLEIEWPQTLRNNATTTNWNQPRLSLGEGFLYATPDGGNLKIGDAPQFIDTYLAAQDPRFRPGGELEDLRRKLSAALSNLQYTTLRVDFIREETFGEDHLLAKIFLAGQGADNGPAVGGFTVNIHNFDEGLRMATGVGGQISGFGQ